MRRLSLLWLGLMMVSILSGCPPSPPPLPPEPPTPVPPTPPPPQVAPPEKQPPLPPGKPALPPPDRAQVTPASPTGDSERQTPEQAAQSACMAHLKVLALAALMYAQDYQERLPVPTRWAPALRPYVRNSDDFRCPTAPSLPVGYAYDRRLLAKPLDDIAYPQQVMMLGDSAVGGANPYCELTAGTLAPRHRNAGNAAFTDGHVKWMGLASLQAQ